MEENEQFSYQEEILNLQEVLSSQPNTDISQLLQQPSAGELQRTTIEAPEGMTLRSDRYLKVVDGFTPGALKNIITISRQSLRVYRVSESKISLFSSSDLPETLEETIFNSTYLI